jgi:AraC-like DNA-binding protein
VTASDPEGAGTLSLRLVQPFTRSLLAARVDPLKLVAGIPIEPIRFLDPDGRIPHVVAMELLARAVQASGDDALGVHAAEEVLPGEFDALEFVARSSGTLRGALEALGRYIRLLHDTARATLAVEGDREVWSLDLPTPHSRAMFEFAFAAIVRTGRSASGRERGPLAIELPFPPPPDTSEQARLFGCPIHWQSSRAAMIFTPDHLDAALAQTNPALAAALHRHAEKLLAELAPSRTFSTRVREHVIAVLQTAEPNADDTARQLKTSERTLRRRLQEEGTTFTDLVSDVRRELALSYLRDENLSLMEIAFLLGFSDASAFHRAFRRWTGVSPSEHRRKILGR